MSIDLNILKSIITDLNIGLDFARNYSSELFDKDHKAFAAFVIDYLKIYRALPTSRVLKDKYSNNDNYIDNIFNNIKNYDNDLNEYSYYLDKLKKRYRKNLVDNLGSKIKKQ